MASIESKQIFVYLKPLLNGIDRAMVSKIKLTDSSLGDDAVICCKKRYANEIFISILFTLHTSDSYKVLPFSRIMSINDASRTGYRDPEYGALSAITDTKILFITTGGYDVSPYAGNVLDVIISTRRSLGLKTYICHLGDKTDFLSNYKSTLLTNIRQLNLGGGSSV